MASNPKLKRALDRYEIWIAAELLARRSQWGASEQGSTRNPRCGKVPFFLTLKVHVPLRHMYTLACLYNTYIQVHGPGGFSRLFTGLLSSQGETGINFVFFIVFL